MYHIYHFILFDTAIESVTEYEDKDCDKEPTSRVVSSYEKGDCFGELEIVHNIPRKTTIAADTTCEVLAIESEVRTTF